MALKNRLNILFKSQNLKQKEFAEMLNLGQSTLNNYLNGLSEPKFDNIMSILDFFPNLNANWLLKGEGEMFNDNNLSNFGNIQILNQKTGIVQEPSEDYKREKERTDLITTEEVLQKQVELLLIEVKRLDLKMELMEKEIQKLKRLKL